VETPSRASNAALTVVSREASDIGIPHGARGLIMAAN
jgi:hypothetical protein